MKKIFTFLSVVALGTFSDAQIIINEVYGGGGGSTSYIKSDYVELINKGNASVTLSGAYLQYSSATSTSAVGASNIQALPDITLSPGQTYLIKEGTGTVGLDLPTPDFSPSINVLNMSATAGKVFLTSNGTAVASATDANIIDFVGYGSTAVWFETAPAPAPSVTTSIYRTNGIDTNDNSKDFTAGAPSPKNSADATLAVGDINKSKINLVKNTIVKDVITFGAKANVQIVNVNGQVVKSVAVDNGTSLDVSSLSKGVYIIKGNVNGETVSQKIIKQ